METERKYNFTSSQKISPFINAT